MSNAPINPVILDEALKAAARVSQAAAERLKRKEEEKIAEQVLNGWTTMAELTKKPTTITEAVLEKSSDAEKNYYNRIEPDRIYRITDRTGKVVEFTGEELKKAFIDMKFETLPEEVRKQILRQLPPDGEALTNLSYQPGNESNMLDALDKLQLKIDMLKVAHADGRAEGEIKTIVAKADSVHNQIDEIKKLLKDAAGTDTTLVKVSDLNPDMDRSVQQARSTEINARFTGLSSTLQKDIIEGMLEIKNPPESAQVKAGRNVNVPEGQNPIGAQGLATIVRATVAEVAGPRK